MKVKLLIEHYNLGAKVTSALLNIRADLCSQGLSEEDAEMAIAGALPYCIFKHVFNLETRKKTKV